MRYLCEAQRLVLRAQGPWSQEPNIRVMMLGSPTREPTGSHSPPRSAGRVGPASAPGGRGWKGAVAEETRGFAESWQHHGAACAPHFKRCPSSPSPQPQDGGSEEREEVLKGLKAGLNDSAAAGGREQNSLARGLQPWRRAWWSRGGRERVKAEVGREWKAL